ncbi:MAG: dihydrofolate reductase [Ruminococcaceae bacterium]|nr:dihydrofolate reductase [Oscillospiraceae bacterium]
MKSIVNVSSDWGIGAGGDMLVHISADLKRFKAITEGKTVIMGRSTLISLPGSKPLKNRRNIILTSRPDDLPEGCEGVASIDALLERVKDLPDDDLCVIGGEAVYRQLLPYCHKAYITRTDISVPAEKYFPNLDSMADWKIVSESEVMEEKGLKFRYVDYERI